MKSKVRKDFLEASEELANTAGRVTNYSSLSELEGRIADLGRILIKYDKAIDKYKKKATCDFCTKPCLEDHCITSEK